MSRSTAILTEWLLMHGRHLKYDRFMDAAAPYGKTIQAFLVIEGWHIRYLLILIGACVFFSLCVIAITATLSKSMDVALTAGSYACGLAAVLLALFTFLSAIL